MQALKTIGLGVAFSFAGFIILLVISIMRGTVSLETGHATGKRLVRAELKVKRAEAALLFAEKMRTKSRSQPIAQAA